MMVIIIRQLRKFEWVEKFIWTLRSKEEADADYILTQMNRFGAISWYNQPSGNKTAKSTL